MFFFSLTLRAFRFLILCFVLFVSFLVIASSSDSRNLCLDGGQLLDSGIPKESLVASKAYLSTVVFQGTLYKVVEERDGTIRAVYGDGKVLKSDDTLMPINSREVEIVYFKRRRAGKKECILPVKDEDLTLGSKYIVFGHRERRFGIVGTAFPEELTKKALRQVSKVLCKNCAKRAGVEGLRNIRLKERQKLRLQCHLKGNPIPWVKWFKDGEEIQGGGRIKVRTKRRSSKVVIRHVRRHDSGVYECRAGNVVDERGTFATATVTITAKNTTTKPQNETNTTAPTLWPGEPCPISDFCLNGGKCTFYRVVGEYVCECAEGYVGLRCHYKDVRVSVSKVKPEMARDPGHLFVNVVVIFTVLFCINWASQLVCWFCWVRRFNPGIKSFRSEI